MRSSQRYWRVPGTQDTKVRSELDTTTEDRIAMQPFYALLDILSELTGFPDLQTWKQTLQIWTGKDVTPKRLLAQVSYVLDNRFPRRYACLLFLDDQHYEDVLQKWHAAFSDRMRRTMLLVQALRRAVTDKTTTSRSSCDKSFDLSNNQAKLANFPYPVLPMKMSAQLGTLLESHPMLPFQGAGGLLSLTLQAFEDYGIAAENYGKGAPSKSQTLKGQVSSTKGKGKGKQQNTKGKSKKGPPKDRDHDSRTDWKKQDDNNYDGWGGGWSSYTSWPSNQQQGSSSKPSRNYNKSSNKSTGKGTKHKSLVHQVQICLACTCALGFNYDCSDCSKSPVPPGFQQKASVPVKALICPALLPEGAICSSPLGTNLKCTLCKEHRTYRSSYQVQTTWPSISTARKCELLQLDRTLYDMDVLDSASTCLDDFINQMNKITGNSKPEDYTPEQWAANWMKKLVEPQTTGLLPIPKTTKIPWANPDWGLTTEDIIVNYGPLEDQVLLATFCTAGWFKTLLHQIWQKSGQYSRPHTPTKEQPQREATAPSSLMRSIGS